MAAVLKIFMTEYVDGLTWDGSVACVLIMETLQCCTQHAQSLIHDNDNIFHIAHLWKIHEYCLSVIKSGVQTYPIFARIYQSLKQIILLFQYFQSHVKSSRISLTSIWCVFSLILYTEDSSRLGRCYWQYIIQLCKIIRCISRWQQW